MKIVEGRLGTKQVDGSMNEEKLVKGLDGKGRMTGWVIMGG